MPPIRQFLNKFLSFIIIGPLAMTKIIVI